MRHLTLMAFATLALAACNGGEDFSDATVPGCPLGAPCNPNLKGEVVVEFVGPQVENLGYICGNSVGYTRSEEATTEDGVVVPPYAAVCPATASRIEFYLGSALFEGNKVSLGHFLLPRKLVKTQYQVTAADLVDPPSRVGQDNPLAQHRVALLNAVSTGSNEVRIIDSAIHIEIDTNALIRDEMPEGAFDPDLDAFDYPDYTSFFEAWGEALGSLDAHAEMEGEGNPDDYEAQLANGADLSRAGVYAFETTFGCAFPSLFDCTGDDEEDYANLTFGISALVLPDGTMLGGGLGQYTESAENTETDFFAFGENAALDQRMTLGAPDVGIALRGVKTLSNMETNAKLEGRFLTQTLYNNVTFLEERGSDFEIDYPSSDYVLSDAELGYLNNTVLGFNATDFPYMATKTNFVQANRDNGLLSAANGTYVVRLYRACVGEPDDEDEVNGEAVCRDVANPEIEIGTGDPFNYPSGVSQERLRNDALDGSGVDEFCIEISGGEIWVGADGACPVVDDPESFKVGMVSRTFADDEALRSVNLVLRLAPGFEHFEVTPHYNADIRGRMDLRTGEEEIDDCRRLLRLGDDGFTSGVRAAWAERDNLPRRKSHQNNADGENPTDADLLLVGALASGAVEFYKKGSSCDPDA